MKNETDQFLIYRSEDGRTRIDVMLEAGGNSGASILNSKIKERVSP